MRLNTVWLVLFIAGLAGQVIARADEAPPAGESAQQAAAEKAPVQIFLVAGQSNAEGHNHIRQYRGGREPFPEHFGPQAEILFWPGPDKNQHDPKRWMSLRVDESGSFGPEIAFGYYYRQARPDARIAIVKYAHGGTGIARSEDYTDYIPTLAGFQDHGRNWSPPDANRKAGNLYAGLLEGVRAATAALDEQQVPWQLAGLLWMQGEHEASISRKMAEDYERLLTNLITSLRRDLQAPALPVVIGGVNAHSWPFAQTVRAAQLAVSKKLEATAVFPTVDLPRVDGDASHFTADGMLTLGERFAGSMLKLCPADGAKAAP